MTPAFKNAFIATGTHLELYADIGHGAKRGNISETELKGIYDKI